MDGQQFDGLARRLADRSTRRGAFLRLLGLGGSAVGAATGTVVLLPQVA